MSTDTPQPYTHTAADGTRTSLIGSVGSSTAITVDFADPRSRSAAGWRARKGLFASRGVTSGPEVAESDAALAWWAVQRRLSAAVAAGSMPADHVDKVLEQLAALPPR